MVNRSKRKNIKKNNPTATPTPEKNLVKPRYEVTTYKPQFVIPANFDHLHNNGGKDTKDKVNPYDQQYHAALAKHIVGKSRNITRQNSIPNFLYVVLIM